MVKFLFICKLTRKASLGYMIPDDPVGWSIYLEKPDMGCPNWSPSHQTKMRELGCKSYDFGFVDNVKLWYEYYPNSKLMETMYGLEENLVDSSDNTDNS